MEKLRFEELNLSKEMQKAITEMGFEEATPIQSQSIPLILEGKDIIGQAQTGTGKTASFGIPALELINPEVKGIQSLILCPTRELAIQVAEELKLLSKHKRNVDIIPVYGGQPIDRQIKVLRKGVQIVIGTPGRVMDHMNRNTLKLDHVRQVILDEADEMLDMGFREDIEFILEKVPAERQTVLFSATMPKPILDITRKFMKQPQLVKVVHKELTVPNIEQFYFEIKESFKPEILSRLLDAYNVKLSLVFCNTKKRVDELVGHLQTRGYLAAGLHRDMKQPQRDLVMSKFRRGTVEILVATDVAARGIDVDDVEAVFNYDIPQDEEYYVHRIGRTGRAGRMGRAFTFVVGREIYKIRDIQQYAKTKILPKKVPSISDVEEVKASALLEKVKSVVDEGHLSKQLSWIEKLLDDNYTSLDIAAALLQMAMGDPTADSKAPVQEEDFGDTGASPGMVRLFINVGRSQNIGARDIVGSIAGESGIPGNLIGSIDIYDRYTFVEVPREYARDVLMAMKDNKIKGKKVNIECANRK